MRIVGEGYGAAKKKKKEREKEKAQKAQTGRIIRVFLGNDCVADGQNGHAFLNDARSFVIAVEVSHQGVFDCTSFRSLW
jgi:hypothetical protein